MRKPAHNRRDLTGYKTEDGIEVLKPGKEIGKILYWICKCSCGKEFEIRSASLLKKNPTKSCGCLFKKIISKHRWTGYEEISGSYWYTVKNLATQNGRNFEFDIKIEDIWDIYIKQDRKCALSGIYIFFSRSSRKKQTVSLDRIDSKKGYIKTNLQLVHKYVNQMKSNFDQDLFIDFCKKIAENMK